MQFARRFAQRSSFDCRDYNQFNVRRSQDLIRQAFKDWGIGYDERHMTLKTFDRQRFPDADRAFKEARRYSWNPMGKLVIAGSTGIGKTHLAVGILRKQAYRQLVCSDFTLSGPLHENLFIKVSDLKKDLRMKWGTKSNEQYRAKWMKRIRNAPFLVLDDLARERDADWFCEVIDEIAESRQNRTTVITTNKSAKEIIHRYGKPVYSRLIMSAQKLHYEGPDQRGAK